MANFTPSKKTAYDFNNGVEYVNGDGEYTGDVINADTINNVIESQLYSQQLSEEIHSLGENIPDITYIADEGAPSVTIETLSNGTKRFKFSHLKGERGAKGDSGIGALSSGWFYLVVDDTTGDLYAEYADETIAPQFEQDNYGNVYYIIGE